MLQLVNMKVVLLILFLVTKYKLYCITVTYPCLGSPTSGNPYYYYELFWNSAVVVDTANSIIQMNQIKFTCKLESLQEDAVSS